MSTTKGGCYNPPMAKEKIILANSEPDYLLFTILDYMRYLPPTERTSVVAGIFNQNTNELSVATSRQFRDPTTQKLIWNHAEFEALSLLSEEERQDALIFISSLSTCARPSETRAHESCTELLNHSGFGWEYVGKIDNNAAKSGLYAVLGFEPVLTENPALLAVCAGLYKYFIPYKEKGWTKQRTIDAALELLPTNY